MHIQAKYMEVQYSWMGIHTMFFMGVGHYKYMHCTHELYNASV